MRSAPGLVALVLLALVPEAAHAGRLERLRRPPLGDTIAVNTHYGAPREMLEPAALASLAAAGVRRIRNDLDWASVERTPGVYDFATARRRRACGRLPCTARPGRRPLVGTGRHLAPASAATECPGARARRDECDPTRARPRCALHPRVRRRAGLPDRADHDPTSGVRF